MGDREVARVRQVGYTSVAGTLLDSRRPLSSLALDGQPDVASGHSKWIARMTSGLKS